jgi:hypothetical protein
MLIVMTWLTAVIHTTANPAMFSDNQITGFSALFANSSQFVDNQLANTALVDRFTSTKYCANLNQTTGSLLTQVLRNANYAANSFEAKHGFFSCEQVLELFCNPGVANKFVATHSVFDCLDFVQPVQSPFGLYQPDDTRSNNNATKIVTLAPTAFQLTAVLAAFMNRFTINTYAIVYAVSSVPGSMQTDLMFYQQLAANLAYKLSVSSAFTLGFSYSLSDPRIATALSDRINCKFFFSKVK